MNRVRSLSLLFILVSSAAFSVDAQSRRSKAYSDWEPVAHLPPPINSEFNDQAPALSKDEKTLFFTSNRPGSVAGSEDIWVSSRRSKNSPWRTPVNLGPTINTDRIERLRSVTADGRVMLFMSDRAGAGQNDIWAIFRKRPNDDLSWSEPINLGQNINSNDNEFAAAYFFPIATRKSGLLFSSNRPGGFGGSDIYESTISDLGFESAVNVFELNSPSVEMCLWISEDGLEVYFISNRPDLTGDLKYNDLYTASRNSIFESWSEPEKLGPEVNSEDHQDVNPWVSADGTTLMLASRRPGGIGSGTFDIYMSTRRRTND